MGSQPAPASAKIKTAAALARIVRQANARGRRVVFTNGCFDLLHAGHVKLLEHARRQGDLLVVGINSDRSVHGLNKGPGRPVMGERDRALLLAALQSVDYVTIFSEPTPQRLIEQLQPDVLMKGADWSASAIVGSDVVRRKGGRVVRYPLLRGYSTTKLIHRIKTTVT
jgi:D-beta-D-heptose 7-phosphate kinase/D-beta-D-heptose 1-phosphate adenosyltransferase